ncbi:MAG: L-seryl-tRNA(Sec) selenium transferase [Candidatus Tectomicrobia bacterium]|nr:L-seryl-tRNA(Sec) selenium transferase [Candidatus Tectomicrobia bacterium]
MPSKPRGNLHLPYLRQLPAVDDLLRTPQAQRWQDQFPRNTVKEAVRQALDVTRRRILQTTDETALAALPVGTAATLSQAGVILRAGEGAELQPLINATGVIVHTNLGRSLLADAAVDNIRTVAASYSNLEYDIERGERGARYGHLESLLRSLTGAEAALVVNNNAAAVYLALQALAKDMEVIVSRGQLIEIGGSFRIPDIMRSSGAVLHEVGSTNKTHLRDYAAGISSETALLLRVHTSNYRIVGFTSEVARHELVALGRKHGLPVMEDLGSGTLLDLQPYGLHDEPTISEVVAGGVDLVTFSGDKLLGGPQAGIVVGKAAYVDRLRRHPMHRAVRVDKFTLAALEATLKLYATADGARHQIPTLAMLGLSAADIARRIRRLRRMMPSRCEAAYRPQVIDGASAVGGGALPLADLPTKLLALQPDFCSVNTLERRLRCRRPAVIGRIARDQLLLDLRTVGDREIPQIAAALNELVPTT